MPPLVSNSSGRVVAIELHPSSSTGATAVPAPSSAPADGPLQGRQSGRLLLLGSRSSLSGGNGASAGALRHRNSTSRSGDAAAMPSPRQQQQQQQQDAEEDADSSTDSQQPASAAAASLARGTRPDPATEGAVMTKEEVGAVCVPCTCFWRPHPFLEAAAKGDVEAVKAMAAREVRLLKLKGYKQRTAWHLAAQHGHVEVLQALVAAVLSCGEAEDALNSSFRRLLSLARTGDRLARHFMNARSKGGATPLILAARAGRAPAVAYLLSAGANPWGYDANGLSPLHVAAIHNQNEVVHELCKHDVAFSRQAIPLNNPTTKYVDVQDRCGWTPLHHAALSGRLEAVRTLISHEANIIARTQLHHPRVEMLPTGLTALHLAAFKGSLPLVKAILRAYYEASADLLPSQTALLATGERRRRQRSHPDPRLLLTRTARLPYHFAHRLGHRHMLEWLDPSIPLMFLFAGTEDDPAAAGAAGEFVVGVPRLTVLAATALHKLLSQQLEAAEQALRERAARGAQQAGGAATAAPARSSVLSLLSLTLGGRTNGRGSTTRYSSSGLPDAVAHSSYQREARHGSQPTAGAAGAAAAAVAGQQHHARPRRMSQPLPSRRGSSTDGRAGAGPSSRTSRLREEIDALELGAEASLMARLRQGVRRVPKDRVCTGQDLLRMGVSIPDHVADNDPVAVMVPPAGSLAPPAQQASVAGSTWHGGSLLSAMASSSVLVLPLREGSVPQRVGSAAAHLRGSEPGPALLLTDDPPTPARDDAADPGRHPFGLDAHDRVRSSSSLAAPLSRLSERSELPPQASDALSDLRQVLMPRSFSTSSLPSSNADGGAAVQAPSPHLTDAPGGDSAAASAPSQQQQPPAGGGRPPAAGGSVRAAGVSVPRAGSRLGPLRMGSRNNRVHPEPSPFAAASAPDGTELIAPEAAAAGQGGEGRQDGAKGAAPADGAGGVHAGEAEEDEDVCPVCLDELPNISMVKCTHRLCLSCAKDLCKRHQLTPALCPMCRDVIPGFALAA